MDTLFNKLQQAYINMQEEALPTEWYHGSPKPIHKFSDDFVGQGVDQEGPGIYFTSNEEDANGYARRSENPEGVVYVVALEFKKLVPLKGKANRKEIMQLIEWAPNLENALTNFDDNPKVAKATLFKNCMNQENPHQSFQQVWYELYRHEPIEFVRNMVILGYDGVVVPRQFMNTKHACVYNPKIIRLIDTH